MLFDAISDDEKRRNALQISDGKLEDKITKSIK